MLSTLYAHAEVPESDAELLSREQYLPDVDGGYRDGRSTQRSTMGPEDVAAWTEAIESRPAGPAEPADRAGQATG